MPFDPLTAVGLVVSHPGPRTRQVAVTSPADEGHLMVTAYNDERLHRSRELRPPSGRGDPIRAGADETITRSMRLGGLLSHYQIGAQAA